MTFTDLQVDLEEKRELWNDARKRLTEAQQQGGDPADLISLTDEVNHCKEEYTTAYEALEKARKKQEGRSGDGLGWVADKAAPELTGTALYAGGWTLAGLGHLFSSSFAAGLGSWISFIGLPAWLIWRIHRTRNLRI